MKGLTISLVVEIVSTILFLLIPAPSARGFAPSVAFGLVAVIIVAALTFYTCLGRLASALGKSWIVWVGLTVITKPIGSFVAYFMMRSNVKALGEPKAALGSS